VTISVTAQPNNVPPRFQITVTSPDGSPITSAALIRVDPSGSAPTRVQPPVPAASGLVVYDYEAPWDVPLVYSIGINYGTGGASSTTFTSTAATLSPPFPYLIHPTAPVLSVCLDQARFDRMGVVSIGAETRPALTTKHRIQGSEYQIVTKTGPRGAQSFALQVAILSAADRAALLAITRDQTPLYIAFPDSWGWDFDDGYYDVGDFGSDRVLQYGPELRRTVTLPLERVEAPIGTQAAAWTWAGLLAAVSSWDAAKAAYATWADVATNTRR
jgi:hypothetical protein